MSEQSKVGVFWSGNCGRLAAKLLADMLVGVFGPARIFISTDIDPGLEWFDKLRAEIDLAVAGLFVLTPDGLESRWLPYECGQFLATKSQQALVPVRVGVEQALLDSRVPVLQRIQSIPLESRGDFMRLCGTCATKLGDPRPIEEISLAAETAWDARAAAIQALTHSIERTLPSRYTGTTRYARLIADTNFNMPRVFELYEQELFFVGINHGYVLNIERDARNFTAMVKSLLEPGTRRQVKFMISDLWEPAVAECYGNLVQAAFAKREIAKFTNIYKTQDSPFSLGPWLESKFGKPALERLVSEDLLEIRTFPSILDTFWFVDGRACQIALANGDGEGRPMFYCGKASDEAPEAFNYYSSLARTAYGSTERLWPPPA